MVFVMVKVIIVGGGRVGIHLIDKLRRRVGYEITLIDYHKNIIEYVEKNYETVNIIYGDATNKKVLKEAGISDANIIVIATSVDEVNLLIAVTAQKYNLDKIIARTTNPDHVKIFKKLGLNEVVSPELAACGDIEKLIISPNVADLAISGKGDCELIEVEVKSSKIVGKKVEEISPNRDFIVVMCQKGSETLIAQNDIVLEKGDSVTVLCKRKVIKKVRKRFTKNSLLPI